MPIGNQEIWDKGIGAGATNVIFGGGDTQPSATNFNPGALGADPNAQPAATTAIETPGADAPGAGPATPATPATPAEPAGPTEAQKKHLQYLQKGVMDAQFSLQSAIAGNHSQSSLGHYQQLIIAAQQRLAQYKLKWGL